MCVYKFRNCLLNTAERAVIKENQHLELTTKTFDVLEYLIENAGKVVSKDELLGNVWNGNFVEESNLPVHISKLRRSLSETRDCRFIETVQGTGYRFVAPLQIVGENEWQTAVSASREFPLADLLASPNAGSSIAVLPLQNEGGNPEFDYLADGLTESLINGLSGTLEMKVIARNTVFRYKQKNVDLQQLGGTLGVSSVLTGRIRVTADDFTISVELIRADDGTQIWGNVYRSSLSSLIEIQEDILFSIIENSTLARLRERRRSSNSLSHHPESYRLYLKGRHLLEKHSAEDIHKAIAFFYKSVSLDSENIYSHVEIVECYRSLHSYGYISYDEFLATTKPILEAVAKANQCLDAVQIVYCDLKMLEWKFDEAALFCKRALAINPSSLKGRLRFSDLLLQSRNYTAALKQLERIMIIDPLSALIYKRIGRLLYMMGDFGNAIAYLNDALELEPANYEALALRGAVHSETLNFEEALRDFSDSFRAESNPETLAMSAIVYAKQGNHSEAEKILKTIETENASQSGQSTMLAHVHLALGRKDKAYDFLESAWTNHEPDLRALTYDRRWETIRSEARFKTLSRRVGLPDLQD